MANMTELQLQGDSTVYKLNDARVTTTSVTTATHILTTNSGVTSIAPITAANLASVLGGQYNNMGTLNTTDFDTVVASGNYKAYFSSESGASIYHCPIAGAVCLVVSNQQNLIMQFVYGSGGAATRSGSLSTLTTVGHWGGWTRLDNFGNNSLSSLASALGVCSPFGAIGSLADADDISNTCMAYIWSNSTGLNPVFTYYFLAERAFQLAIIDRATIKFRYKWNSTWNAWYDLT